jgi:hypothetical protein
MGQEQSSVSLEECKSRCERENEPSFCCGDNDSVDEDVIVDGSNSDYESF